MDKEQGKTCCRPDTPHKKVLFPFCGDPDTVILVDKLQAAVTDLCCFFSMVLGIFYQVGKYLLDNRVAVELEVVDVQPEFQRSNLLKRDDRAQDLLVYWSWR